VIGDRMHRRAWSMEDALADPTATAVSIWEKLAATGIKAWARDDLQHVEVL
jgi:hypothetical protein